VARRAAAVVLALLAVAAAAAAARPAGGPAIATPRPYALVKWDPDTDNVAVASGRVTLGGAPVAGLRLRVDRWRLPRATSADGAFSYPADVTRLARHEVAVVDADEASVKGARVSQSERDALLRATAAISVAYPVHDLVAGRDARGNPTVSGRLSFRDGSAPPTVALSSYELSGTVIDSHGKPVVGARVSTRTLDRDFWTVSSPTDAAGRYRSVFIASSELGGDPVPFSVRVAKGDIVYEFLPDENVLFRRLQSARMDLRLPPKNFPLALPLPTSYPGAVYGGVAAGVAVDGRPVRLLAATWPDARGRFRLTLPRELRGQTVSLWEARLELFSGARATAGGAIDLRDWPAQLPADAPRDLASVTLPR
jgi:hypothetical protein